MASHEFRTPLSTINSSASLIKKYHEKGSYEKLNKHADRIKKSVRNLTSILNDFLSFEKLEAGKVGVNTKEWSVPYILQETFDEMTDITKSNQSIIYEGPKELKILTDGQLLKNTMLNMLSNAVKYSRDDGEIIVSLEDHEEKIRISVQDFGMGIPVKDQKNLFTRFFRAGNVTNVEGTGLGLNIVLRYLDLLNGKISFESKEGEGTIFFITLPK
jgi:signal transduction histidine kinase